MDCAGTLLRYLLLQYQILEFNVIVTFFKCFTPLHLHLERHSIVVLQSQLHKHALLPKHSFEESFSSKSREDESAGSEATIANCCPRSRMLLKRGSPSVLTSSCRSTLISAAKASCRLLALALLYEDCGWIPAAAPGAVAVGLLLYCVVDAFPP